MVGATSNDAADVASKGSRFKRKLNIALVPGEISNIILSNKKTNS